MGPSCNRFECFCLAACSLPCACGLQCGSVGRCQSATAIGGPKKIFDSFVCQNCINGLNLHVHRIASRASLNKESMQDLEATGIKNSVAIYRDGGNFKSASYPVAPDIHLTRFTCPMLVRALNFHNAKMLLHVGQPVRRATISHYRQWELLPHFIVVIRGVKWKVNTTVVVPLTL